eukprot:2850183-Alexandrium_andersonii.AAC.1
MTDHFPIIFDVRTKFKAQTTDRPKQYSFRNLSQEDKDCYGDEVDRLICQCAFPSLEETMHEAAGKAFRKSEIVPRRPWI